MEELVQECHTRTYVNVAMSGHAKWIDVTVIYNLYVVG